MRTTSTLATAADAAQINRVMQRFDPFARIKARHLAGTLRPTSADVGAERRCATCGALLLAGQVRHCRGCVAESQDFAN